MVNRFTLFRLHVAQGNAKLMGFETTASRLRLLRRQLSRKDLTEPSQMQNRDMWARGKILETRQRLADEIADMDARLSLRNAVKQECENRGRSEPAGMDESERHYLISTITNRMGKYTLALGAFFIMIDPIKHLFTHDSSLWGAAKVFAVFSAIVVAGWNAVDLFVSKSPESCGSSVNRALDWADKGLKHAKDSLIKDES